MRRSSSKTWRDKATERTIMQKVNRRRNPVTTYTQLAQELGAPVYGVGRPNGGPATSGSFRTYICNTVGQNLFA